MSATLITYGSAGMASWQAETFTDIEFFHDTVPDRWTRGELLDPSMLVGLPPYPDGTPATEFPMGSVVGRNANGNMVLADGQNVKPLGVTMAPVRVGAVNLNVPVAFAGSFNIDALSWHANYNTDLLKIRAFEAAGYGGCFNNKKRNYAGVYFAGQQQSAP